MHFVPSKHIRHASEQACARREGNCR
jgi:hypothetical protein